MQYPKEIIGTKFENNKCYYLVKWKKFDEPTWEPSNNISHRTDLIQEYKDMLVLENLSLSSSGYIYCRVSSKKQSKYSEGHTSLEVQEAKCKQYCDNNEKHIINTVKETSSAKNMDKMEGLQHILNIASRGQTIYIYDISRFSRNTRQALNILEELKEKGVVIYSVTENLECNNAATMNQFRLQLCASNYHSDICSEKVKESIKYRKTRGDVIGGVKYGYKTERDEKTYVLKKVVNEEEMKVIEIIRENKNYHVKIIKNILIEKEIVFRRGLSPSLSGIKNIIKRFETDLKINYVKRKQKLRINIKPY